ncbi:LysR family transcriptional regulator [Tropicimonas sediminicola]|uniref:DNA-binding transcriptional regulator, LysR family n=1 Tax=Tropicimonas sediminicola TaxID=1031541 RepID=A0A239L007_9RHOB|nr:LysR family transcriptional regulator [Tropicimonas sediminicola]SNT22884.1 DNA-binding transcriptional regulator, LysR family [Tropicimonas sediminicola]
MLNATWLETFTVLCETRHFTRAAQRLNMTQPGVSQHLRKLEGQIGRALVDKEGKSFALTPAGEAVFAMGQARRAEERRLRELVETDDPDVGAAHIACSGSFATLLYPHLLRLMHDAPGLQVHLEAAPRRSVLAGVLEDRFDLGILGEDPRHPRLEARQIGTEELCLVLPAEAAAEPVTFDGLQARGFIAHPDGYAYADDLFALNFEDAFSGADRLRLRGFVNQIGQIPAAVAAGIGYTLLPRSGVDAYSGRDRLWLAALPRRRYHALWLVHRKGRRLNARLSRLAQVIGAVADTLSPG